MERFNNCKEHSERIYELKSAICAINEIQICSHDPQWLTQYQYILNWCYCQMRFISNPAERLRLFQEVKLFTKLCKFEDKYRRMFEVLSDVEDVDKLTSYLHWSQVCYQYAELIDRESLSWCIEAVINAKNALFESSSRSSTLSGKTDSSGSHRSTSTNNSVNGNEQMESIGSENQRRVKIATVGLIQSNVLKAENVYACCLKRRLKVVL
uniref:FAT domain-containing protein n=1 Tax=Elaeophora elaphi TaxID=1147741 RepID=A0A0R3RN13_9BILA